MANPRFEVIEETGVTTDEQPFTIAAPVLPEIPDNASPEEAAKIVAVIEEKVKNLPPISKYAKKAYGELGEMLKADATKLDAIKLNMTKPLRDEVDAINGAYKPLVDGLKAMVKRIADVVAGYVTEQQRIEDEMQAKINAEAEKERLNALAKAEESRKAAEAAKAQGNVQEAAKLENKANLYEMKAEAAIPEVVERTTGKIATADGGSFTVSVKPTWALTGWPKGNDGKYKPLRCTDPLLKSVIGDMDALPSGVQFLLRTSDVNPVHLNNAFKAGEEFPKPFTKVAESSSRRS